MRWQRSLLSSRSLPVPPRALHTPPRITHHGVHESVPVGSNAEIMPSGQGEQEWSAEAAYVPALHTVHASSPVLPHRPLWPSVAKPVGLQVGQGR